MIIRNTFFTILHFGRVKFHATVGGAAYILVKNRAAVGDTAHILGILDLGKSEIPSSEHKLFEWSGKKSEWRGLRVPASTSRVA